MLPVTEKNVWVEKSTSDNSIYSRFREQAQRNIVRHCPYENVLFSTLFNNLQSESAAELKYNIYKLEINSH